MAAPPNITATSNLNRFRPKIASRAAGTPLNHHQRTVAQANAAIANRRRLPTTAEATQVGLQ